MDKRERYLNPDETFTLAFEGRQTRIWTMIPGIINKVPGSNGGKMTVDVQPALNGRTTDINGGESFLQMPVVLDCPILFPGGGGVTLTFPLKVGGECAIFFSARAIDNWWASGQVSDTHSYRMHSLSDGFCMPGVLSNPNAFAYDPNVAALTSNDQQTFVKLDPAGKLVTVTATGGINLNGATIDQNGNIHTPTAITATGNITSSATVQGLEVKNSVGTTLTHHVHPSNGAPPTPGT